MKVLFLEPAQAEFAEAVDYYNAQSEGLGLEFSDEVKATILRIIEHPEAWPPISKKNKTLPDKALSGFGQNTLIRCSIPEG